MKDHDIHNNIAALSANFSDRSYRDVHDHRDLLASRVETSRAVRDRTGDKRVEPIILTPWPDGHKTRTFSIPDVVDELILRITIGHFVSTLDRSLPDAVFSGRLRKRPPGWTLRPNNGAHKARRAHSLRLVGDRRADRAIVTDVTSYYESVDVDLLLQQLEAAEIAEHDRSRLRLLFARWHGDGLTGIPIGPESSAPLGACFLSPIDDAIHSAGASFNRFSDDYLVCYPRTVESTTLLECIDRHFDDLGLHRSTPKTFIFDDARDALDHMSHARIAYFADGPAALTGDYAVNLLRENLQTDDVDYQLVRFVMGWLRRSKDPAAARLLATEPNLWAWAPTRSSEYVSELLGSGHSFDADDFFTMLTQSVVAGTQVVMTRAARNRPWGLAEGRFFDAVSLDEEENVLVRAETAAALPRTPVWNPDEAVDRCIGDQPLPVKRALTGGFRHAPRNERTQKRLKRIASVDSLLAATARWAAVA